MLLCWTVAWAVSLPIAYFLLIAPILEYELYSAWNSIPFVMALLAAGLVFGYGTGWPLARARPKQ